MGQWNFAQEGVLEYINLYVEAIIKLIVTRVNLRNEIVNPGKLSKRSAMEHVIDVQFILVEDQVSLNQKRLHLHRHQQQCHLRRRHHQS